MKTENIIDFNEIDFEDNIYDTFLLYKGKPFSGKLRDGNQIIEYKNGNFDGLTITLFPNGKISAEEQYENGKYIQGKHWYQDGKLKSITTGKANKKYSKDGKIAYELKDEISTWYYPNGEIKQRVNRKNYQTNCFISNGKIAIEIERKNDISFVKYYDDILISDFKDLITNFYPELDSLSSSSGGHEHFPQHCFQLWVLKLLEQKPAIGKKILNELENFPDNNIKDMADTIKMHHVDFKLREVAKGFWGYCGYKIKKLSLTAVLQKRLFSK